MLYHLNQYILTYIDLLMTKHPNQQFRKLVVDVRNKNFKYPEQENRKTHWQNYNLSKINDIKSILVFIRKSVDSIFINEDFDKVGRPLLIQDIWLKQFCFVRQ